MSGSSETGFVSHDDSERAIKYWENAVRIQDTLYYGEPPEWSYPVRESLGSRLLLNEQVDQAEAVFRAGLKQHFEVLDGSPVIFTPRSVVVISVLKPNGKR